jgi:hypothetical protein
MPRSGPVMSASAASSFRSTPDSPMPKNSADILPSGVAQSRVLRGSAGIAGEVLVEALQNRLVPEMLSGRRRPPTRSATRARRRPIDAQQYQTDQSV